jgi:hypothetical protein
VEVIEGITVWLEMAVELAVDVGFEAVDVPIAVAIDVDVAVAMTVLEVDVFVADALDAGGAVAVRVFEGVGVGVLVVAGPVGPEPNQKPELNL